MSDLTKKEKELKAKLEKYADTNDAFVNGIYKKLRQRVKKIDKIQ